MSRTQSQIIMDRAEQRVAQEGSSPSGAQMRGAISKSGGNSSLAEESGVSGNRKRGQANRIEAAKAKAQPKATGRLKPLRLFSTPQLWYLGGQGVHQVEDHKMESEGHEEKYRAAVNEATQ